MPDPIVEDPPVPTPTPEPETKGPDLAKVVESLSAKYGGVDAALRQLVAENYNARDQIRELKARLPADGSVSLSAEDARAWEAYRTLGKPEDVRRLKAERDQFEGEVGGLRRNEELRSVCEVAKVSLAVLKQIAGDRSFEVRPVKDIRTGKDVPTVFVKDGDAEAVPFDDYAQKAWTPFLPALRPDTQATFGTPRIDPAAAPKDQIERRKQNVIPLVR